MANETDEPPERAAPEEDAASDAADKDDEFDRLFARRGWLLRLTKQLGGAVTALAVEGGYAYAGKGYRLLVLNLTNPLRPRIAGHSPTLDEMTRQVFVHGNLAVAATFGSVYLFDVGDPSAPVQRSQIPASLEQGGIALRFPYLSVASYTKEEGELTITFDISDPAQPRRVAAAPREYGEVVLAGQIEGSRYYYARGDKLLIYDL